MKYKVGDKFLVEITGINDSCYPYTLNEIGVITTEETLDKLRRPDDMTAEEAWEIARKIVCDKDCGGLSLKELSEAFGGACFQDALLNYTPQQAKAKIEAWKAEKEVKVGDEITAKDDDGDELKLFVQKITRAKPIKYWGIINYADGTVKTGFVSHRNDIKKTGRHIDIQGLLKQIGGRNDV